MKRFFNLLRYLIPYKWFVVQNIVYNILGAFFALFSFAMIIPFLGVLFDNQELVTEQAPFALNMDYFMHTLDYYMSMIMTNSDSIQDVLFFPQMRPEKKVEADPDEAFTSLGIPSLWVPHLREKGINTIDELRTENPNKLANDLNGLRKKKKLDIPAINPLELKEWISA